MGEHAIEFKAWQVGTQFIVDETQLNNHIKDLMQSSDQTKVKVKLDKTSLKLTKISTIPLMGSEKKIPLSEIKNMFTDSKFPLYFFCTVSVHDGHLLKIIVIRCNKEMCATGIVNYFRTLTYNRRHPPNQRKESGISTRANVPTAVASAAKYRNPNQTAPYEKAINNGDLDRNDKETEKIKVPTQKAEFNEALKTEKLADPAKDDRIGTQENYIKMSSKEVEKIEKQPAVIGNHEYTDVQKQGIPPSEKYSRNVRHYSIVSAKPGRGQAQKPKNSYKAYHAGHNRYILVNDEGRYLRARANTISTVPRGNNVNTQVFHSNKENENTKSATLPTKSEVPPEIPELREPAPGKDAAPTGSEEPIYATVVKIKGNKEGNQESNGDAKLQIDTSDTVRMVKAPPSPRTVTFRNLSSEMQRRQSQKGQNENVAHPVYYHQLQRPVSEIMSLNTYVHKPIEKVYNNNTSLTRSWKLSESRRPRVNSNTFKDDRQLVALYRDTF